MRPRHLIQICFLLIVLFGNFARGDNLMSLFAQGIEELNAGQLDAALETFKQITTTAPDFPDAHYHLGLVYYRKAQFREAAAAFKQTLKFLPRDVAALVNLGLASYRAEEMSEAVNAYRTALEIQPHNVEALNNLGLAYQELGQFEEAIAAYDKALRLRPDLPEVEANLATARELQRGTYSLVAYRHYRTGMQLKRAGNAQAAVAAWKQAIAESPDYRLAHLQLAETYFEGGAYERAISAYLLALELHPDAGAETIDIRPSNRPDDADIFYNLGNSYLYAGKLESAVSAYQRAVEINPKMASAWANMGTVLLELERLDAAIAACEKALEIVPAAHQIRATLTTAQGIKSGQWTMQAYRLWKRGVAAANRGETQTAIDLWSQASALSPNYAQVHESLGWTYFTLQRFDDAIQACQAARTSFAAQLTTFALELKAGKYPFRAYQLWEQGRRASAAGELEQAVALLSQAVSAGPGFIEASNTLAWLYADKLGTNLAEAEKLARRAISLSGSADVPGAPDRPHLHHTLGWILYKQERYSEALNAFDVALRHSPDNAEYLYHASLAAVKNGATPQALAYLAQAIKQDARWIETARTQREFDAIRFQAGFRALVP